MTIRDLKKLTNPKSFRFFILATTDGKRFHITSELSIGISKSKKRVRVGIQRGDSVIWIFEPEEIC
jgi:hypothetical protein